VIATRIEFQRSISIPAWAPAMSCHPGFDLRTVSPTRPVAGAASADPIEGRVTVAGAGTPDAE
jgi:hypothetical protein